MRRLTFVLFLLLTSPALAAVNGTWFGDFLGHTSTLLLRERADGQIVGFMPTDPNARIIGGELQGDNLVLHISITDPVVSTTGTIDATLSGNDITGTFTLDGDITPVSFEKRKDKKHRLEYWVMGENEIHSRAMRLMNKKGNFLGGGMVGIENCDFLACAGDFVDWDVSGAAHDLTLESGGGCPVYADLNGLWDDSDKFLLGTYDGSDCNGILSGDLVAAKAGLADARGLQKALKLLARFSYQVQNESFNALNQISDSYLNDGKTKVHWQSDLAELYNQYDNLQVQVAGIREIITDNDADVNPVILAPPRIVWQLVITGEPEGGGATQTITDIEFSHDGNQQLLMISMEKNRYQFIGNGYATPFEIELPVAALADSTNTVYGIWPFGVHGGGHPEGHAGWDLEFAAGAQVHAAADGIITQIEPNDGNPGQSDITISHRPGIQSRYHHIENIAPGIVVDAEVNVGDVLGDPGFFPPGFYASHFDLQFFTNNVCPSEFLSSSAAALFDLIWSDAAYMEELVEPYPCQSLSADFPLSLNWVRSEGILAPRIEFVRLSANDSSYEYVMRDAFDVIIESGTATVDPVTSPSSIDLVPDGGGATHLGIYLIESGEMEIDWDDLVRPADLTAASIYQAQ